MAISASQFLQGNQGPGFSGGFSAGQALAQRYARAQWDEAQKKEITDAKNIYKSLVNETKEGGIDYSAAIKPFMVKHPELLKQITPQYSSAAGIDKKALMQELTKYNPELAEQSINAATKELNFADINSKFKGMVTPDIYSSIVGQQSAGKGWENVGSNTLYNQETGEIKYLTDQEGEKGDPVINAAIAGRLHLVKDQGGYNALKEKAKVNGFDTSAWPLEFNEENKNNLLLTAIGDPEKELKIIKGQEQIQIQEERNRLSRARQAATDKKTQAMIDLQLKRLDAMEKRSTDREDERLKEKTFARQKNLLSMPKILQDAHSPDQILSNSGAKEVALVSTEAPAMMQQVDKLKNLISLHGLEKMPGPVKADMESTLKLIQILMKGDSFARLGVLNGPDLEFLEEIVSDPTSMYNLDPKSVQKRLDNTNAFARNKFKAILSFHGFNGVEASDLYIDEKNDIKPEEDEELTDRKKTLRKKYGY